MDDSRGEAPTEVTFIVYIEVFLTVQLPLAGDLNNRNIEASNLNIVVYLKILNFHFCKNKALI